MLAEGHLVRFNAGHGAFQALATGACLAASGGEIVDGGGDAGEAFKALRACFPLARRIGRCRAYLVGGQVVQQMVFAV